MTTSYESFQRFLGDFFFPNQGAKKRKKAKDLDRIDFGRSDATAERVAIFGNGSTCALYGGFDYPDFVIGDGSTESPRDELIDRLASLIPNQPERVSETLDDRRLSLLAFRADSYVLFSPPEGAAPHPSILARKDALKGLEESLSRGIDGDASGPNARDSVPRVETFAIAHPAEFIAARLFLPPRAAVSGHSFASVPLAVTAKPAWPQNTRHQCLKASFSFGGQTLSVRYHTDVSPTASAHADAVAKAAVGAFFREALGFWSSWKRPIERPSLVPSPEPAAASSIFLVGEIRGEGNRVRCAVEMHPDFIALALKMARVSPRDPATPPGLVDFVRASDALFNLMKSMYRRPFLAKPEGSVPVKGLTMYGLLSLIDAADASIVIQNFLIPRYELQNLPFFFYYHALSQNAANETAYSLRPAFPLAPGEIERFLPETARRDWNFALSRGCPLRVSTAANLAELNAEAMELLATDAIAGKILLSEKACAILREEVLAPLDAALRERVDEANRRIEAFSCLKTAQPKAIAAMLSRIDNQTLAAACLGLAGSLASLERGMSAARKSDVRAEIAIAQKRYDRKELSSKRVLEAKNALGDLCEGLASPGEETVG